MAIDFVKDDEFSFWLPMDIVKASPEEKKKGHRRLVQGVASTTDEDLQKETVDQHGIDFSYFLKFGYYNNDHKPGFENKVGQPIDCRVTKEGLWTKGFLFNNHKIADAIWELANALEASQADRKLGFSIQGKVTRRAGRRILKCWIQDIAVTAAPINTHTWLDVVKSLSATPAEYFCDDTGCFYVSPRQISPVYKSRCDSACVKADAQAMNKVFFTGGLAIDEEKMTLRKDRECPCKDGKKALSVGGGSILVPESLEGDTKDQDWASKAAQEYAQKALHFDECVDLLQKFRGLARPDAVVVAEAVFELNQRSN